MEMMCSSENPSDFQRTTRRYIPENSKKKKLSVWDVEAPTFSVDNRLTNGGEVK
jgi:hypothetical protein